MKRIISFVLVFALAFSFVVPAMAEDVEGNSGLVAAVADMLPLLMDIPQNNGTTFKLGKKLAAYKVEESGISEVEYDIFPIFINQEIVALAQVSNVSGQTQISCVTGYASGLNQYYSANRTNEIAVVYANEGTFLISKNASPICIYESKSDSLASLASVQSQLTSITLDSISASQYFSPHNRVMSARSLQYQKRDVATVQNHTVTSDECATCAGHGLCWAACTAMIVNYYRNRLYTALDIHNGTGHYSISANATNYKSAIQTYGVTASGPYSSFTYSTLATMIQGNKLAFLYIKRTNSSGTEVAHALVANGYYYYPENSTTKYFYFKDPSAGDGICAFPTSGTIYINTNGYTYSLGYYISTEY